MTGFEYRHFGTYSAHGVLVVSQPGRRMPAEHFSRLAGRAVLQRTC